MNPQKQITLFNKEIGRTVKIAYQAGYEEGKKDGMKELEDLKDAYYSDCWGHYRR